MQFGNRRGSDLDRAVVAGDDLLPSRITTRLLGWLGLALGFGTVLVLLFAD